MNLTNDKVSEWIAVLMGKCWHECHTYTMLIDHCEKCGVKLDIFWVWNSEDKNDKYNKGTINNQFNAFTPDGIFEWKEFMERGMPEVWEEYLEKSLCVYDIHPNPITDSMMDNIFILMFNQTLNARHFAEWMAGNMELLPDKYRELIKEWEVK